MMEKDAALVVAAEDGQTDTVRALLDAGAYVHAVDDLALWLAAKNGHSETVKVLLDAGANVHADEDAAEPMSMPTRRRRCAGRRKAATPIPSGC